MDEKPYRWPARPGLAEDSRLDFRIELTDGTFGVPSQIAAYLLGDLIATAQGSGWGEAALVLPISETFDGFLEIEPALRGLGRQIFYSGPVFRATLLSASILPTNLKRVTPEPGSAAVGIYIFDCLGVRASGVTFELEGAVGQRFYFSTEGDLSTNAQQTDEIGFGGFTNLSAPPDAVSVVAKRGGMIVARKLIRMREDWLTLALLWPRSEDE